MGSRERTVLMLCAAGSSRSAVAAACVNHYARERGLSVAAESAGLYADAVHNVRRLRPEVASIVRSAHRGAHRPYLTAAQKGGAYLLAGTLLLEEGIPEILDIRPQLATPDLVARADLVLTAEKRHLAALPPCNGKAHTLRGFIGYPAGDEDIVEPRVSFRRPSALMEAYAELYAGIAEDAQRLLDAIER